MTQLRKIRALLDERIATPGDGSLLDGALAQLLDRPSEPATELEMVEVLLAAWDECHRDLAVLKNGLRRIVSVPSAHDLLHDAVAKAMASIAEDTLREVEGR